MGNLPYSVSKSDLQEHFCQFGSINRVTLPLKPDSSTNKGFAFIIYEEESSLQNALENEEHIIEDRRLVVRDSKTGRPKAEEVRKVAEVAGFEAFVGNLPYSAEKSQLEEHFSQFGTVKRVTLPLKPDQSSTKGFAYVAFEEESCLQDALDADEHIIAGRSVRVQSKKNKSEIMSLASEKAPKHSRALLVTKLSDGTSAKTLSLHFGRYGEVERVDMIQGGGARVVFKAETSTDSALEDQHQIDYTYATVRKTFVPTAPAADQSDDEEEKDSESDEEDNESDDDDEEVVDSDEEIFKEGREADEGETDESEDESDDE